MADVTKIKNGVLIECDCGLNHKVTVNPETKEVKLKTTYSQREEKPETKTEVKKDEIKKEEKPNEENTQKEFLWFE